MNYTATKKGGITLTRKTISITIEEGLLEAIDSICEEYSKQKKSNYSRSQFFTEASLFLMAYSDELKHSQEENKDIKEEN